MITLSIHIPSLVIGFFGGYIVIATVWMVVLWHDGGRFENGWDAGYEYGKTVGKERAEREIEPFKGDT